MAEKNKDRTASAQQAQNYFTRGKYGRVLELLKELQTKTSQDKDIRIDQNMTLTKYLQQEMSLEQCRDTLIELCGSPGESSSGSSTDVDTGVTVSSFSCARELSCLRYNIACIHFQQLSYASAATILDSLWRCIEPIDDTAAIHICFLYLDVIFQACEGDRPPRVMKDLCLKALGILAYLEKPHSFGTLLSGTSADATEFRFRMQLYKSKLALVEEPSNFKLVKKEIKATMEIFQKEIRGGTSSTAVGQIFPSIPGPQVQQMQGYFLKAHLEYLKANYAKSMKFLALCINEPDDSKHVHAVEVQNNLGCIHYHLKHYHSAQSYFSRALEGCVKSKLNYQNRNHHQKTTLNQHNMLAPSMENEILYNNGIQFLQQQKYVVAFRCFYQVSKCYTNRPKVWLRMGECCLAVYAQEKDKVPSQDQSKLVKSILGSGMQRRVVIPVNEQDRSLPTKTLSASAEEHMTLPFAVKCFRNVLSLTTQCLAASSSSVSGSETSNNHGEKQPSAAVENNASSTAEEVNLPASATEQFDTKMDMLRQSTLVKLTYVYLSLHESYLALSTAKELLSLPTCSPSNGFLARCYCAEALISQSRTVEALEVLSGTIDASTNVNDPIPTAAAEEYCRSRQGKDAIESRVGIYVNLATAHILQNKFNQAEHFAMKALKTSSTSPQALRLLVYIFLRKGSTSNALKVLASGRAVL